MTISRFNRAFAIAALLCAALPVAAQVATTPSGQVVTLFDVVLEEEPGVARFRFLAPAIDPTGEGLTYEDVAADFEYLCESYAVPALREAAQEPEQIVISLSDREVTFGEVSTDATQYFEAFTVADETCLLDDPEDLIH